MRFYKGDIVEIISLGKYDDQFVTLGYKYYVAVDSITDDLTSIVIGSNRTHSFESCRMMLYKRPITNTVKSLFVKK